GAFTYNGRDRALAWGGVTASPFSQGYTQNQIGGGMGGPVVRDRFSVFGALQGRWKDQALPPLATADAATLERLGVSPDSAARFLALPEARVHVTSDLPDSIQGIATLAFGGNHAFPQHTDNIATEVREEVSWLTQDATHRIKLGGYLSSGRLHANQTPNQLGTFV